MGSTGHKQVLQHVVGFYDYSGFVGRIGEEIGLRMEEKMVHKKVDIAPFISKVLDWTRKKPDIFSKEKVQILNFG